MKKKAFALAGIALVALAAGVFLYQDRRPGGPPDPPPGVTPGGQDSPSTRPQKPADRSETSVVIYRVDPGNDQELPHLVRLEVQIPRGEEPMAAALNAMAQQKDSPLPPRTQARSVKLTNDIARVDFNDAFKGNFIGGDSEEALAIHAVLATLRQFPGVKRVQITMEGKPIESLGGHFELTEPLSTDDVPVLKGEASQTAQDDHRQGGVR